MDGREAVLLGNVRNADVRIPQILLGPIDSELVNVLDRRQACRSFEQFEKITSADSKLIVIRFQWPQLAVQDILIHSLQKLVHSVIGNHLILQCEFKKILDELQELTLCFTLRI